MVRSEGNMSLKNPVTQPGIDPGTVRLLAQRLKHYTTPGKIVILGSKNFEESDSIMCIKVQLICLPTAYKAHTHTKYVRLFVTRQKCKPSFEYRLSTVRNVPPLQPLLNPGYN
jgi:ABC-type Mn2+/Zn2+ transport system ATPase subunit